MRKGMLRRGILCSLLCLATWVISALAVDTYDDPTPSVETGAKVYATRCVLCHGNKGMGEGVLPMRMKDYPSTMLLNPKLANNHQEILYVTVYGAVDKKVSTYMPPFGKELSWTELESVAQFVHLMRNDKEKAYALLQTQTPKGNASKKVGRQIYSTRCVLCHGEFAEGDGRMSRMLKNPPPADLTASRLPDPYLKDIIMKGGEAVGRSKHMPPWGDQLSETEIESLMVFLKSIRD